MLKFLEYHNLLQTTTRAVSYGGNVDMYFLVRCKHSNSSEKKSGEENEKVVEVVNKRKLDRWLSVTEERGFKKIFTGNGYTELLVDEKRPFEIKYTFCSEMVRLKCYYGAWNVEGVPQHI